MICFGPKDKWQHDLEKMSRAALVEVVAEMQWRLALYRDGFDRDQMGALIEKCKIYGRWNNDAARFARFMADPAKAADQFIRRQKSAKSAARRKKKAVKQAGYKINADLAAISNRYSKVRWQA